MSSPEHNGRNTKNQQKKMASSIGKAHVMAVFYQCKIVQNVAKDKKYTKKMQKLLRDVLFELDKVDEISMVLQSLKFSDRVFIYLDFDKSDLSAVAKSDALGWFKQAEGELIIGAKDMLEDRKYFMGVFAHELTHWSMQTVFKNQGFPYYEGDPSRDIEEEYDDIVREVQSVEQTKLHCIISSVFRDYRSRAQWHQELIVRVPHLLAENGTDEATRILNEYPSTQRLLHFYRTYVMREMRDFVSDGDLEKSRETVYKLNQKLGLIQMYQQHGIRFNEPVDIDWSQDTSILVLSSPHPFFTFLKVTWTLHYKERTDKFYGNNIFCDFSSFSDNFLDVLMRLRGLDECKTLVMVCPSNVGSTYRNLFSYLAKDVFATKTDKKVILIIDEDKLLGTTQEQLALIPEVSHRCISLPAMGFQHIDESSRTQILEVPITINEVTIEMQELVGQDEYHLADGDFIERWILEEEFILGRLNISLYDRPPSFVSIYEKLTSQRLLELIHESIDNDSPANFGMILIGYLKDYPKLIDKKLRDVFSCINLNEVLVSSSDEYENHSHETFIPIILLKPGVVEDYIPLVNALRNRSRCDVFYFINVKSTKVIYCHLIFYPDIVFQRQLQKKKTDIEGDETLITVVGQDDFIQMVDLGLDRVVVLSDHAGTGKTQFLNLISNAISNHWAIKFSLKAVATFIDDHPLETDLEEDDAVRFILTMARIDDGFAEKLLKYKIHSTSGFPVVLLLDGMDEITGSDRGTSSENKRKIGNFIWFLKNKTLFKVVLVTRAEPETDLSYLNCPTYEFKPMTMRNGQAYLEKLYTARHRLFSASEVSEETMKNVRSFIPEYIGESIKTPIASDFLKNPLHISMVSEIVVESAKNGDLGTVKSETKGNLRIDKLYERFIKIKYRIYYKEKKSTVVDVRLEKHCNSVFQHLALFYLFRNEELTARCFLKNDLFNCESGKASLNLEEVELYFDIGIISASPSGIDFIHRTFAEYFASLMFLSWTDEESQTERMMNVFIHNPDRCFYFFESMMGHVKIPEKILVAYGNLMTRVEFRRTTHAFAHHILIHNFNVLKFIFECWKKVGKIGVILDPRTYSGQNAERYPLFFASKFAGDRMVQRLIQEGFHTSYEPPIITEERGSVISYLLRRGNVKLILSTLLVDKMDINNLLTTPNASLVRHMLYGVRKTVIEWLQLRGFSYYSNKRFGDFLMMYSIAEGKLEMANWLKNEGIRVHESTGIAIAVKLRKFNMIEWLVGEGVEINSLTQKGRTPLHDAVLDGKLDMVEFLCRHGANIKGRSDKGFSALHFACLLNKPNEDLQIIKWLIEQGCSPEDVTKSGCTALQLLLLYSTNDDCIEWVLDHCSNIHALDADGKSYLHYAASNKKKFHISILLVKGCSVYVRDKYNATPAHSAILTMSNFKSYEYEIDSNIKEYLRFLLDPFKLLVSKMSETDETIFGELLCYVGARTSNEKNSIHLIYETAIKWLTAEALKHKQLVRLGEKPLALG